MRDEPQATLLPPPPDFELLDVEALGFEVVFDPESDDDEGLEDDPDEPVDPEESLDDELPLSDEVELAAESEDLLASAELLLEPDDDRLSVL